MGEYFDPRDVKKLRLRVASPSGQKQVQHLHRAPDGHLDEHSDEPFATLNAAPVDVRPEIATPARSTHTANDLPRTAGHQFSEIADSALTTPKASARLAGAWVWLRSKWRAFASNGDALESASISSASAQHSIPEVRQHALAAPPRSHTPYQPSAIRRSTVVRPVIIPDNVNADDVLLRDDPITGDWDERGLRILKRGKE